MPFFEDEGNCIGKGGRFRQGDNVNTRCHHFAHVGFVQVQNALNHAAFIFGKPFNGFGFADDGRQNTDFVIAQDVDLGVFLAFWLGFQPKQAFVEGKNRLAQPEKPLNQVEDDVGVPWADVPRQCCGQNVPDGKEDQHDDAEERPG